MADEKSEKLKALDLALGQIDRQFGKGSVMRLGDRKIIDEFKMLAEPLEVMAISAQRNKDLAKDLGKNLFDLLEIARIYTKEPGKDPAKEPIVAQRGITVGELAKMVHNDFYERFKYARIWGSAAKFPNEKVGIDRRLDDGTIIQIYV